MKINITKEHIDKSIARDSHHCMVADAVQEAIPDAQYILVDTQSIRYSLKDENKRYVHLTPLTVQKNIIDWDRGKKVQPFSFTLPSVYSAREMGWTGQRSKNSKRKSKKSTTKKQKRSIVAYRERSFGLRNIPE